MESSGELWKAMDGEIYPTQEEAIKANRVAFKEYLARAKERNRNRALSATDLLQEKLSELFDRGDDEGSVDACDVFSFLINNEDLVRDFVDDLSGLAICEFSPEYRDCNCEEGVSR